MSALVVAGGSRGIGLSIVLGAVARGHDVIFAGRTERDLRVAEERARALGPACSSEARSSLGRAVGVRCDVARDQDVAALFAEARERYASVGAVVANAAISLGGLLSLTSDDEVASVLATNVGGVVSVLRHGARALASSKAAGVRTMVVVGSLAARGAPANAVYAASKATLEPLVRHVDRELAPTGIRTHLVVPGLVDTELVASLGAATRERLVTCAPLRRSASPDELGQLVLELALGAGRALAGTPIHATAGLQEIPG